MAHRTEILLSNIDTRWLSFLFVLVLHDVTITKYRCDTMVASILISNIFSGSWELIEFPDTMQTNYSL